MKNDVCTRAVPLTWAKEKYSGFSSTLQTIPLGQVKNIHTARHASYIRSFLIEFELTNLSEEHRGRVTVHTIQLLPQRAFRINETQETMSLDPEAKSEAVLPITVSLRTLYMYKIKWRIFLMIYVAVSYNTITINFCIYRVVILWKFAWPSIGQTLKTSLCLLPSPSTVSSPVPQASRLWVGELASGLTSLCMTSIFLWLYKFLRTWFRIFWRAWSSYVCTW